MSILNKIGIDKSTLDLDCQDWEYTLADPRYLKDYIELYKSDKTTELEKRVLGCFIIQSIDDLLPNQIHDKEVIQKLKLLENDHEIHKDEFLYWSSVDDKNEENLFYITKYIRKITQA